MAAISRGLFVGADVFLQKRLAGGEFLGLKHWRRGIDALDHAGAPGHVGGLDGVAAQQPHVGVIDLAQRVYQCQRLKIVEGGNNHLDLRRLKFAGQ
ncbi:hypothetical protein D3C71_1828140 [compost metagenome]